MTSAELIGLPRWVRGLALAAVWVGVWGLGHLGEIATHASVWYPPAALTFASLAVLGSRAVPYLVVASFGGTLWSIEIYQVEASWTTIAGFAVCNATAHIGSYAVGAFALRRFSARYRHQLPNVVLTFLIAAAASSVLATAGVVAALQLFGLLGPEGLLTTSLAFWTGDFVALVVLAPLFAALLLRMVRQSEIWIEPQLYLRQERLSGSFGFKLTLIGLLLLAAMLIANRLQTYEAAFLVFFILIPQLWLTYTESPVATAISLAVVSFLIIVLLGPLQLGRFAFVYQLAIAIIATTAYFGLAIPLLEAANSRLRQRLLFYPLTGASTRDYLREKAEQLHPARPCSLAVVDVDHFKHINDGHGHSVGDQALISLVECLRGHMQGSDMVARFGGDEFMVLLNDCDREDASARMQRVLDAIRGVRLTDDVQLTASIGIAARRPDEDFDAWFARADEALYAAKRAGRDRVN